MGIKDIKSKKYLSNKVKVTILISLVLVVLALLYFTNLPNYLFFENPVFEDSEEQVFNKYFPLGTNYELTSGDQHAEWQMRIVQVVVEGYFEDDLYSYMKVGYSIGSFEENNLQQKTAKVLLNTKEGFFEDLLGNEYVNYVEDPWILELENTQITFFDSWSDVIEYEMSGITTEVFEIKSVDINTFKELFPKETLISFRVLAYYPEEEVDNELCYYLSIEQCASAKYYNENGGYEELFNDGSEDVLLIPLSGFILEII